MSERTCAYRRCKRLARPGGRFCSDTHRWKQWDLEHPRTNRPPRRARTESGIRIYFLPDELETVTVITTPRRGDINARHRAFKKIREARERLAGRRASDGSSDRE